MGSERVLHTLATIHRKPRLRSFSPAEFKPLRSFVRPLTALLLAGTLISPNAFAKEGDIPTDAPYCEPGQFPNFDSTLQSFNIQLKGKLGNPLECMHQDPDTGNTIQQTTSGIAFESATSGLPAFETNDALIFTQTAQGIVSWQTDNLGILSDLTPPESARSVDMGITTSALNETSAPTDNDPDIIAQVPDGNIPASASQIIKSYGDINKGFLVNIHATQDQTTMPILAPFGKDDPEREQKLQAFFTLYSPIWQDPNVANAKTQLDIIDRAQFQQKYLEKSDQHEIGIGGGETAHITLLRDSVLRLPSRPDRNDIGKVDVAFENNVCDPTIKGKIDSFESLLLARNIGGLITRGFKGSWSDGMNGIQKIGQLYDYFKIACWNTKTNTFDYLH